MQIEGINANPTTFVCVLKACGNIRDVNQGRNLHTEFEMNGMLKNNLFVGNALMDMYAKCNDLQEAHDVFEKLPNRDSVSWNTLIGSYVEHDFGEEALKCFEYMQSEGLFPNPVTFIGILKACCSTGSIEKGKQIHEEIVNRCFLHKDIALGNALVDMYSKSARQVLGELPIRDVVSWSTLIAGYAQHNQGDKALACFAEMRREGLYPNEVTFVCILNACGSMEDIDKGKLIHENIVCRGFPGNDIALGNALVTMHAKCGMLVKAKEVLEELPVRDVVSWNALIAGYAQQGRGNEALYYFEWMQVEGLSPNLITFISILKACGSTGAVRKGKQIHMEIVNRGLLEMDIVLANALMDMYARCGFLTNARRLLEELPVRDAIAWNTLITGYVQEGQSHEALNCFENMQSEGVYPTVATFVCCLKACGSIESVGQGKIAHHEIVKSGFESDVAVGTALIDMYSKCGSMADAQQIFDTTHIKDSLKCTALITGYARQGNTELVFHMFEKMKKEGIKPDEITFLSVLNACSHGGLVKKGQEYYMTMIREHGLISTIKHHSCMVDLLCRAGRLNEAIIMLEKFKIKPDLVTWTAVLSGCQKWGNIGLGS